MSLQRLANIKNFIQESIDNNNYMVDSDEALIRVRNTLVNFLKDDALEVAKSNNIEPRLMRGMIAELMCEYLFRHYMEENDIDKKNYVSNIMIKNEATGRTTQLDSVCLIDKAVFVIECKSFYGPMVIKDGMIKTKTVTQEPWNQNYGHIKALERKFGKMKYINVIYLFGMGLIDEYVPQKGLSGGEQHLLVNHGGLHTIHRLAKDPLNNQNSIPRNFINDLHQMIPTVKEEYEHINNINKLREMIKS